MALHPRSLCVAAGMAVVLVMAALPGPGRAEQSHVVLTPKLDWQTAQALAAEAVRVCAARGFSVTATVVDTSGERQAVIKGDQAPLQSLSVSYRKAYIPRIRTAWPSTRIPPARWWRPS